MNSIDTVFYYHERTKHHRERYAASLGYMDWATQPDPFRSYSGSTYIELPLTLEYPTLSIFYGYCLMESSRSKSLGTTM